MQTATLTKSPTWLWILRLIVFLGAIVTPFEHYASNPSDIPSVYFAPVFTVLKVALAVVVFLLLLEWIKETAAVQPQVSKPEPVVKPPVAPRPVVQIEAAIVPAAAVPTPQATAARATPPLPKNANPAQVKAHAEAHPELKGVFPYVRQFNEDPKDPNSRVIGEIVGRVEFAGTPQEKYIFPGDKKERRFTARKMARRARALFDMLQNTNVVKAI